MATYISYDGQPHIVNLDNTDFIRLKDTSGSFEIEFFKSERISKEQRPTFIISWPFTVKAERDAVVEKLLREHGSSISLTDNTRKLWTS